MIDSGTGLVKCLDVGVGTASTVGAAPPYQKAPALLFWEGRGEDQYIYMWC